MKISYFLPTSLSVSASLFSAHFFTIIPTLEFFSNFIQLLLVVVFSVRSETREETISQLVPHSLLPAWHTTPLLICSFLQPTAVKTEYDLDENSQKFTQFSGSMLNSFKYCNLHSPRKLVTAEECCNNLHFWRLIWQSSLRSSSSSYFCWKARGCAARRATPATAQVRRSPSWPHINFQLLYPPPLPQCPRESWNVCLNLNLINLILILKF